MTYLGSPLLPLACLFAGLSGCWVFAGPPVVVLVVLRGVWGGVVAPWGYLGFRFKGTYVGELPPVSYLWFI